MTRTSELSDVSLDATQNLLDSLSSNDYSRIRSALRTSNLDLNYHDSLSDSETLLMRICRLEVLPKNRYDIMKMVLDKPGKKVNVNAEDINGLSALAHACKLGDESLIRLLAEDVSIDPNQGDRDGNTPLIHACSTGNASAVSTLIACFESLILNVDQSNDDGMTPLMEAARRGHTDVCRILVSQGHADVSLRSKTANFTAKDYAVDHGRCHTPDLLLLDVVAQRKIRARQARKAMGRSILDDLCPEMRIQKLGQSSTSRTMTPFEQSAKQIRHIPLSKEYIDQMNSIVFQVSRNVERLAEDLDGEERELLEDAEVVQEAVKETRSRRLSNVSLPEKPPAYKLRPRRGSLPVAVGAGRSLLRRNEVVVTSKETDMPKTEATDTLRLPRVRKTGKGAPQNLSTSPTSPSYMSKAQTSPRLSPIASPTSPRDTTKKSPRRGYKEQGCTQSQPRPQSNTRSSGSKSGNWGGKSSTSVPSYLFR